MCSLSISQTPTYTPAHPQERRRPRHRGGGGKGLSGGTDPLLRSISAVCVVLKDLQTHRWQHLTAVTVPPTTGGLSWADGLATEGIHK